MNQQYIITISFSKTKRNSFLGDFQVSYNSNSNTTDVFKFKPTKIVIECNRSKKYTKEQIFQHANNSIYHQIQKALVAYVVNNVSNARISKILISRKLPVKGMKNDFYQKYSYSSQPIPMIKSSQIRFNPNITQLILEENEKSHELRTTLLHWFLGNINSTDCYSCFEHFWRSFERAAMYHNNNLPQADKKEFVAMRNMRTFILNHTILFTYANSIAQDVKYDQVRLFKWREFLLSEYNQPTQNCCQNYIDHFITPNNDERILQLERDTMVYLKKKLDTFNLYTTAINIINSKNQNYRSNFELLSVLICKYAYYYRCKLFHGETIDRQLFIPIETSKAEQSVSLLNTILKNLCADLINSFDQL